MTISNKLKQGDTIGIIAPSGKINEEGKKHLENFVQYAKGLGFNIQLGKNIFSTDTFGFSSGTPQVRADDINQMFKDKSIKAIWSFQGGQTANQILPLIDYNSIKKNPKIFMGMSDNDLLLLAINKETGLVTFNSANPKRGQAFNMDLEYSQKSFSERIVEGKKEIIPASEWKTLKEGEATGKILGCNLSVILKLAGTKYFPDFKNSILFLESYKEESRVVAYELEQLKQLGVFDKVKGIVIGYIFWFYQREDDAKINPNLSFEEMVLEATKEHNFPILKINEFGHKCNNAFLPIGAKVFVDATNKKIELIENFLK